MPPDSRVLSVYFLRLTTNAVCACPGNAICARNLCARSVRNLGACQYEAGVRAGDTGIECRGSKSEVLQTAGMGGHREAMPAQCVRCMTKLKAAIGARVRYFR
jgi:hypothetical protein